MPFCYKCKETSYSNSCPLIFCDDCKTPWHLDCLNPPLTHPPYVTTKYVTNNRGQDKEVFQKEFWQCPLHVAGTLQYVTEPGNDISRGFNIRKMNPKKRKVQVAPNNGFGFFNTGDFELDHAPEDAETGDTMYRMPEEAVINNFMLKCTQYVAFVFMFMFSLTNTTRRNKVKQQKDVVGLIGLLPLEDRAEMEKIVVKNFNDRVEEVVNHRMHMFKKLEDHAVQKIQILPEDQREFVRELAAFPATVQKRNLELLVQATEQVDAAEETVGNMSLDQIATLEALLANQKRKLLSKAIEPIAGGSGRAQSVVSQATGAAEE
jgi:hypothetical protein